MNKGKGKNALIGCLIIIILILCVLLFLAMRGKNGAEVDYEELAKFGSSDYNYIHYDYDNEHSVKILQDGKVMIDFNNTITNISDAKDLILFIGPGNSNTYILTNKGKVYKYSMGDVSKNDFNATMLDEYTNVERLVRYRTRKANAGGCDYVIAIDNKGEYHLLDSYCV